MMYMYVYNDIPLRMPLISFSHWIYFIRTQLKQPLMQLLPSPVKPIITRQKSELK